MRGRQSVALDSSLINAPRRFFEKGERALFLSSSSSRSMMHDAACREDSSRTSTRDLLDARFVVVVVVANATTATTTAATAKIYSAKIRHPTAAAATGRLELLGFWLLSRSIANDSRADTNNYFPGALPLSVNPKQQQQSADSVFRSAHCALVSLSFTHQPHLT